MLVYNFVGGCILCPSITINNKIIFIFIYVLSEKVFSFLSKDEVEQLKQEEERKIATLQRDKKTHKTLADRFNEDDYEDEKDDIDGGKADDDDDDEDDDDDDDSDDDDDDEEADSDENRNSDAGR